MCQHVIGQEHIRLHPFPDELLRQLTGKERTAGGNPGLPSHLDRPCRRIDPQDGNAVGSKVFQHIPIVTGGFDDYAVGVEMPGAHNGLGAVAKMFQE